MCFNKNSSSAASKTTNTTNRDERIAADNGAVVYGVKDIGSGEGSSVSIAISDASPDILKQQIAANSEAYENSLNFALEERERSDEWLQSIFDTAFEFAAGAADGARQFAAETQASYQEAAAAAATQDTTELSQKLIQYGGLAIISFFLFRYLGGN